MILGVYGDSRVGKDTLAGILVAKYGFVQRNMASKIRDMMLQINPYLLWQNNMWKLEDIYENCEGDWDRIKAECPASVDFMIALGQSARDHIGDTVWLGAVTNDLPDRLVIPDVRQPNEYDWIKKNGGQVWRVLRPGSQRRGMDGLLEDRHFDAVIWNNKTLESLEKAIDHAIEWSLS